MRKPFFARYSWWILAAVTVIGPVIAFLAILAVKTNCNKVEDWLPKTYKETTELAWFRKHFVADLFVIVSWDGCRLGGNPSNADAAPDDARIERFARAIVPDPDSPNAEKCLRYFKSVTTGRRILTQMTSPPLSLSYNEAVERLKGSLIGPDGHQTCVVVTLKDEAIQHLAEAIGRGIRGPFREQKKPGLLMNVLRDCDISADSVRLGGPPVDNVAIDEEGERTLMRLAGLSALFALGLAWWSLRSIKLTIMVFNCGLLSAAAGLTIVYLTGERMDAIMMSMPSMVYILAISGAVHVVNHYREAVKDLGFLGAPDWAVKHAWKPAVLCNVTTALGMISLYTSEIVPIRKFGVYSAMGVMVTLTILFTYLPAALQVWPPKPKKSRGKQDRPDDARALQKLYEHSMDRFWQTVGSWIIRHHAFVAISFVLFICFVSFGLFRIHTSIDLLKLFDPNARILKDYAWMESNLGRLIPMEIVLRFTPSAQASREDPQGHAAERASQLSFLERMETVAAVQRLIDREFGVEAADLVGRSMSPVTFAPKLPSGQNTLKLALRTATNQRLETSRGEFMRSGYFCVDPKDGSELWRVSLRVAAFQNIDYGHFVTDLRDVIEPAMAACGVRGQILDAVQSRRSGDRYAGATVYFWDRSDTTLGTNGPTSRHQRLFAKALKDLLVQARLRVVQGEVDPTTVPVTNLDKLRPYDCVVLLGGFSERDIELIQNRLAGTIDAQRYLSQHLASVHAGNSADVHPTGVSAIYTGIVPIVYKAQRSLLNSLIQSAVWSFLTITPLIMLVCRSVPAGSVAMLPNVLPILFIFGGMGWLNIKVDIGSMMAASIALGVAVDDTIHFLTWFRDNLDRMGDRKQALLAAYRCCATPATQAALISGLGLSVFATSTFTPTQRFGWLMLTILIAGVVAELILMPALLAGPLGAVFRPSKKKRHSPDPHAAEQEQVVFEPVGSESAAEGASVNPAPAPIPPMHFRPAVQVSDSRVQPRSA